MEDIKKAIEEGLILTTKGEPFKIRYKRVLNGRPRTGMSTHNRTGTRAHRIWKNMKNRCNNPKADNYKYYGGRGIKVCDRWNLFENFISDMGDPPTKDHSLDRIDPNGDYSPDNCRWLHFKLQARNTRSNRILTLNGESKCIAEWADIIGVSAYTISARLKRGLSVEDALKPIH